MSRTSNTFSLNCPIFLQVELLNQYRKIMDKCSPLGIGSDLFFFFQGFTPERCVHS
jgi:hypothetical protein